MYKKVVLENYANFDGRARRREFWLFTLLSAIIGYGLLFILTLISPKIALLSSVYNLAVLIPSIAVGVRRMHDVGKSGWYLLIPIYSLILACTEGEKGPNQYGADPKNQLEDLEEIGKKDLN